MRDPSYKKLIEIRKSSAAGAHKDKTKIIPRKQKYDKSEINQLQQVSYRERRHKGC